MIHNQSFVSLKYPSSVENDGVEYLLRCSHSLTPSTCIHEMNAIVFCSWWRTHVPSESEFFSISPPLAWKNCWFMHWFDLIDKRKQFLDVNSFNLLFLFHHGMKAMAIAQHHSDPNCSWEIASSIAVTINLKAPFELCILFGQTEANSFYNIAGLFRSTSFRSSLELNEKCKAKNMKNILDEWKSFRRSQRHCRSHCAVHYVLQIPLFAGFCILITFVKCSSFCI